MDEAGSKVRQQLFEAVEDRSLREMQSDKVVCYFSLSLSLSLSHGSFVSWWRRNRTTLQNGGLQVQESCSKSEMSWNIMLRYVK